jgi:hypothetical protein
MFASLLIVILMFLSCRHIEYIVDMVSRDGQHKCIGIWAYDRRPINGAAFVPFGNRLLTMDDPHTHELVEYQKKVLDALKIKYGPTHGEVKWFQGEPVLVEVCTFLLLVYIIAPSFLLPLVSSHVILSTL